MHPDNTTPPPAEPPAPDRTKRPLGTAGAIFLALFGIVTPLATLIVELAAGLCAGFLFDPIPTPMHVAMVALVPLANTALMVALLRRSQGGIRGLAWLNGLAIGIATYYALLFLPISPFALVGVIFYGIGLLPLSPLTSFVSALILRKRLSRMAGSIPAFMPRVWAAFFVALAALVLTEAPRSASLVGLQMATSPDTSVRPRGIRMLRRYGNRDTLLRACYSQRGVAADPLTFVINEFGRRVSTRDARRVYYQVTGTPFNAVHPPKIRTRGGWMFGDFDMDVGGDQVQARVRDLSLDASRVDTTIDPDACTAYTEWTLEFRNDSARQQEARGQVVLPPGGVVSRLTLWINGEECEAAFGGRKQVRQAYESVVRRRRDPVLVTTSGPDRVLVQCFPVPPNGGTMKLRMGITSPTVLTSLDRGHYRLPHFVERNFGIRADMQNAVWLASDSPLLPSESGNKQDIPTLKEVAEADGSFSLRGKTPAEFAEKPVWVELQRDPATRATWAPDTRQEEPAVVSQQITSEPADRPGALILVVDASRRMKRFRAGIADALDALPAGMPFALLAAGDTVEVLAPLAVTGPESIKAATRRLRRHGFAGGADNVPALSQAWELASLQQDSTVLWLHATQPVNFGTIGSLKQQWQRATRTPALIGMQFGSGPDVIMPQLQAMGVTHHPFLAGNGSARLKSLLSQWAGTVPTLGFARTRAAATAKAPLGVKTSDHLGRLWANDTINQVLAGDPAKDRDRAVELATTYQLVTPVSGAVVLETAAQYKNAGLEPVAKSSVPSIPEPETWALMGVAAVFLLAHEIRRRERLPLRIRF